MKWGLESDLLQHIPDNDWDDPDTSNNDTRILLIESPTRMENVEE